jgi:hypothetical protein
LGGGGGEIVSEELSGTSALTVPQVDLAGDYRLRSIGALLEGSSHPMPYDESDGTVTVVGP